MVLLVAATTILKMYCNAEIFISNDNNTSHVMEIIKLAMNVGLRAYCHYIVCHCKDPEGRQGAYRRVPETVQVQQRSLLCCCCRP